MGAYFGDDSGSQPLTLNGDGTFQLDHEYVAPGPYTVTVTALDLQGGLGSATGQLGPAVSISDAAPVTEGLTQQFTVTLSQAASFPVNVQFATQDGTAKQGTDYQVLDPTSGTLTFAAGETSKTITVQTLFDASNTGGPDPSNPTGLTYTVTATSSQPVFSPAVPATGVIDPLDAVTGSLTIYDGGTPVPRAVQNSVGGFVDADGGSSAWTFA